MMKQLYPEPVAGVFVMDKRGRLLFVKTYKWPEMYAIPGGHIELGESIEEAAKRETKEEVGLDVKFKKVINIQEGIYPKGFHKKAHFIFIDVLCTTNNDRVKIDNNEIQDYMWIRPKEALKLKMNKYTKAALIQLIKGENKKWFYAEAK